MRVTHFSSDLFFFHSAHIDSNDNELFSILTGVLAPTIHDDNNIYCGIYQLTPAVRQLPNFPTSHLNIYSFHIISII